MKNEIIRKIIITLFALVLLCYDFSLGLTKSLGNQEKPNIILIYIDDMGYADIANYGKPYGNTFFETPSMDQLVQEGMKFTDAYAPASMCSPARVALLTGRSAARLNFEFVTKYEDADYTWEDEEWISHWQGRELLPPPFTLNLPLEEITLAEALKEAGYTSGIVGKWHVAAHYQQYKGWSQTHGPKQQGFDYAAETFGAHPYGYRNEYGLGNFGEYEEGEFPEDELTNRAIEFIQKDHDQPFFLFVSHYYVHDPFDSRVEWLVNKYRQKAGPDVSEERIIYAAMMETLDHYVGQLLNAIDVAGLYDDTVVILTSDNGGHPEVSYHRPFRGSKWNLYEAGIRIPMIVRWPGVVEEGSVSDAPVSQIDFMPTFREIAGLKDEFERELDGLSIVPLLHGEDPDNYNNRNLIWHFPYYHPEGQAYEGAEAQIGIEDGYVSRTTPQSAIRRGEYKLIYFYEEDRYELYDLLEDPGEQQDLSKIRPWNTRIMKDKLFDELKNADARFPRLNPQE